MGTGTRSGFFSALAVVVILTVAGAWSVLRSSSATAQCDKAQDVELEAMASIVQSVVPDATVRPLNHCATGGDPQLIAVAPRVMQADDVRRRFNQAGWTMQARLLTAPDRLHYVTWGWTGENARGAVEISVQAVGYRPPAND